MTYEKGGIGAGLSIKAEAKDTPTRKNELIIITLLELLQ